MTNHKVYRLIQFALLCLLVLVLFGIADAQLYSGVGYAGAKPNRIVYAANSYVGEGQADAHDPRFLIPEQVHNVSQLSPIITVPILLEGNQAISAAGLSIQLDPCLQLIDSDVDANGIPDGIIIDLPDQVSRFVNYDPKDSNGQVDFVLVDFLPPYQLLPNAALIELKLLSNCMPAQGNSQIASVRFGTSPKASFSNVNGQSVAVTLTDGHVALTLDPSGTASLPPTIPSVPVPDLDPDAPTQPVDPLQVNAPPQTTPDNVTVAEDQSILVDAANNDRDENGGIPTVTGLVNQPSNGTAILDESGLITYTPSPNYYGNDALIYLLSDGQGGTATGLVNITVQPVNDAPLFVDFPELLTSIEGDSVDFAFLGSDVESDVEELTYSIFGLPSGVSFSSIGQLSGTLAPGSAGVHEIIVMVSDGELASSDFFVWEVQPSGQQPGGSVGQNIYLPMTLH